MADVIENKFGRLTGWNKVTANVLGRDLEAINRVAYGDKVDKANAYGGGRYPIGREEKQYEPDEPVLGLYQEEVRGLLVSAAGKRIQDIEPFDITVEYELPSGVILRDRIHNCEFINNGVDVKQGDGSIVTDYKLICSHITWNTI